MPAINDAINEILTKVHLVRNKHDALFRTGLSSLLNNAQSNFDQNLRVAHTLLNHVRNPPSHLGLPTLAATPTPETPAIATLDVASLLPPASPQPTRSRARKGVADAGQKGDTGEAHESGDQVDHDEDENEGEDEVEAENVPLPTPSPKMMRSKAVAKGTGKRRQNAVRFNGDGAGPSTLKTQRHSVKYSPSSALADPPTAGPSTADAGTPAAPRCSSSSVNSGSTVFHTPPSDKDILLDKPIVRPRKESSNLPPQPITPDVMHDATANVEAPETPKELSNLRDSELIARPRKQSSNLLSEPTTLEGKQDPAANVKSPEAPQSDQLEDEDSLQKETHTSTPQCHRGIATPHLSSPADKETTTPHQEGATSVNQDPSAEPVDSQPDSLSTAKHRSSLRDSVSASEDPLPSVCRKISDFNVNTPAPSHAVTNGESTDEETPVIRRGNRQKNNRKDSIAFVSNQVSDSESLPADEELLHDEHAQEEIDNVRTVGEDFNVPNLTDEDIRPPSPQARAHRHEDAEEDFTPMVEYDTEDEDQKPEEEHSADDEECADAILGASDTCRVIDTYETDKGKLNVHEGKTHYPSDEEPQKRGEPVDRMPIDDSVDGVDIVEQTELDVVVEQSDPEDDNRRAREEVGDVGVNEEEEDEDAEQAACIGRDETGEEEVNFRKSTDDKVNLLLSPTHDSHSEDHEPSSPKNLVVNRKKSVAFKDLTEYSSPQHDTLRSEERRLSTGSGNDSREPSVATTTPFAVSRDGSLSLAAIDALSEMAAVPVPTQTRPPTENKKMRPTQVRRVFSSTRTSFLAKTPGERPPLSALQQSSPVRFSNDKENIDEEYMNPDIDVDVPEAKTMTTAEAHREEALDTTSTIQKILGSDLIPKSEARMRIESVRGERIASRGDILGSSQRPLSVHRSAFRSSRLENAQDAGDNDDVIEPQRPALKDVNRMQDEGTGVINVDEEPEQNSSLYSRRASVVSGQGDDVVPKDSELSQPSYQSARASLKRHRGDDGGGQEEFNESEVASNLKKRRSSDVTGTHTPAKFSGTSQRIRHDVSGGTIDGERGAEASGGGRLLNLVANVSSFLPTASSILGLGLQKDEKNEKEEEDVEMILQRQREDDERREAEMQARREEMRRTKQIEILERQRRAEAKRKALAEATRVKEEERRRKDERRQQKRHEEEEKRRREKLEEDKKREERRRQVLKRKLMEQKERELETKKAKREKMAHGTMPRGLLGHEGSSSRANKHGLEFMSLSEGDGSHMETPPQKKKRLSAAGPSSYMITPAKETVIHESDEEEERRRGKWVPKWAEKERVLQKAEDQPDPDDHFAQMPSCSLPDMFGAQRKYRTRSSSGNWAKDRVTAQEKMAYKKATRGFDEEE